MYCFQHTNHHVHLFKYVFINHNNQNYEESLIYKQLKELSLFETLVLMFFVKSFL